MNLSVVSLFVLFVLRCGEQKFFFNYAANKELQQVNLSEKNGARSHVRVAEGQEVRGVFPLHSNLSENLRSFGTTTDLFGPDAASPAFCSAVG